MNTTFHHTGGVDQHGGPSNDSDIAFHRSVAAGMEDNQNFNEISASLSSRCDLILLNESAFSALSIKTFSNIKTFNYMLICVCVCVCSRVTL